MPVSLRESAILAFTSLSLSLCRAHTHTHTHVNVQIFCFFSVALVLNYFFTQSFRYVKTLNGLFTYAMLVLLITNLIGVSLVGIQVKIRRTYVKVFGNAKYRVRCINEIWNEFVNKHTNVVRF